MARCVQSRASQQSKPGSGYIRHDTEFSGEPPSGYYRALSCKKTFDFSIRSTRHSCCDDTTPTLTSPIVGTGNFSRRAARKLQGL